MPRFVQLVMTFPLMFVGASDKSASNTSALQDYRWGEIHCHVLPSQMMRQILQVFL
jgi:hypothetical protein